MPTCTEVILYSPMRSSSRYGNCAQVIWNVFTLDRYPVMHVGWSEFLRLVSVIRITIRRNRLSAGFEVDALCERQNCNTFAISGENMEMFVYSGVKIHLAYLLIRYFACQ